jgi:hypothetical protein
VIHWRRAAEQRDELDEARRFLRRNGIIDALRKLSRCWADAMRLFMKRDSQRLLWASAIVTLWGALAFGQQAGSRDWDAFDNRYASTSLSSLLAHTSQTPARRKGDRLFVPAERYSLCATFVGSRRAISEARRAFLADSLRAAGGDTALSRLYDQDLLVRDGKTEHWLSVQRQLLTGIHNEIRPGSPVRLYVAWLGAVGADIVLDLEEFGPCVK